MTLYQIIKALQGAQGSNAKLAILQEHKDNELLKAYLKATYDPSISFYQKVAPAPECVYDGTLREININGIVHMLSDRVVTGKEAIGWLRGEIEAYDVESQELIKLMIARSIGASIGDTLILKTWPDLYFIPGYMRCSLFVPKIKKHFDSLDEIIIQKKADGTFCYVIDQHGNSPKAFSRNGSHYPTWLVKRLLLGASTPSNSVFVGELLVVDKDTGLVLDRQIGNGLCNSVLKGADESEFAEYDFLMEAWDILPVNDFKEGLCKIPYKDRFGCLKAELDWGHINIVPIETHFVKNMEQAYAINSKNLLAGFEGSVVKDGASHWKDHTSPFNVKLKIAFEAEYVVTGTFEGAGKYAGMLGGYNIETSDGLLKCSVGTGLTDAMRKNPPAQVGDIITVVANDVVSRKDSPFKSLFLPVYSDVRFDKTEADILERVMEQLASAKGLK